MGKDYRSLQQQQQRGSHESETLVGYNLFSRRCSVAVSRISNELNFKCVFLLIVSLFLLVSVMFWKFPARMSSPVNCYDAAEQIKIDSIVQAYFKLQNPVSELVPVIGKLEYDIYGEIGVPNMKVAILSMHPSSASNWSKVVFGALPHPVNSTVDPISLSLLRSSLVELFLQQINLTLTNSTFRQPSMFEILKFPGGITVIPHSYFAGNMPKSLFNFTLNNSISEILGKSVELKDQLEFGLHLTPYENVYLQITNMGGSTIDPPVIVQASVLSDIGGLLPQRLRQLAQTIRDSPAKNLGLDNSVFGNVRTVILSSYLKGELHASPPALSPAPSPKLNNYAEPSISPSPADSLSHHPSPSPADYTPPAESPTIEPFNSLPPVNCPAPSSIITTDHSRPCFRHTLSSSHSPSDPTPYPHPVGSPPSIPVGLSPVSGVSYSSTPGTHSVSPSFAAPPGALPPSY